MYATLCQEVQSELTVFCQLSLLDTSWSDNLTAPIDVPSCSTIDSLNAPLTPLPSSTGWTHWQLPHTTKHFWRTDVVGSQIDFEVDVVKGHIMLYYLRSRSMGLGRVECWLDDEQNERRVLDGYWTITPYAYFSFLVVCG